MKRILFTLILLASFSLFAQEIPGVTQYRTNGRSGLYDMITDTAWINHQIADYVSSHAAVIDSIIQSGDTLFIYTGDLIIPVLLQGYWTADGENIVNTNVGAVQTIGELHVGDVVEAVNLKQIGVWNETTGRAEKTTLQAVVTAGELENILDPSLYTPWWRDTTNGAIRQAHDTDWVNIDHKLQIGQIKEPGYNLEVTGNSYFSGDVFHNDTIWLVGGEVIHATGNGFIVLSTGGYTHIKNVLKIEPQSAAPSTPTEGVMYYDSDDHKLKVWNGTTWTEL